MRRSLRRPALGIAALSLALIASACASRATTAEPVVAVASATVEPSASPSASPSPTPSTASSTRPVAITSLGGDAWGWHERVRGITEGRCGEVGLQVNGHSTVIAHVRHHRFAAKVPLGGGADRVQALCEQGPPSRSDPITFEERLSAEPRARISVAVVGDSVELDGSGSRPSRHTGDPIVGYSWHARPGNPAALRTTGGESLSGWVAGSSISLATPAVDGEYYVTLRAAAANGALDATTTYFVVRGGRAHAVDVFDGNPDWIDHAVVYGVVPFLFGPHGLESVTQKLPYLRRLGINTIWLSPIFRSPIGDYGYAVTDYFRLNPHYGTKHQFAALMKRAHQLGIRVLLDFPVNDTSDHHPYFRDAETNGRRSPYYDFYDRKADGTPTHYFNWRNLPNLNYDNGQVRRMVVAAAKYWVRRFDVDGFRLDAAWGVQKRDPTFWSHFCHELRRVKPDLLLLAEASARDSAYFEDGFNVAYDWSQQVGRWAWSGVFDNTTAIAPYLNAALTNLGEGYPAGAVVFRFLNNNDTGPRFLSLYGMRMTRVASAMLFTLPGVPELFTGDEVGASYMPYTNEGPISWKDKHHLRPYYRSLIRLREQWPSLRGHGWHPVETQSARVFGYTRWAGGSATPLLVLLNYGPHTVVHVRLGGRAATLVGLHLEDLLGGSSVPPSNGSTLRIRLDAWSAVVLAPKGSHP